MKRILKVKKRVSTGRYMLEDAVGRPTVLSSQINLSNGDSVLVVNNVIIKVVGEINHITYTV